MLGQPYPHGVKVTSETIRPAQTCPVIRTWRPSKILLSNKGRLFVCAQLPDADVAPADLGR